jgi:hypothetical protein
MMGAAAVCKTFVVLVWRRCEQHARSFLARRTVVAIHLCGDGVINQLKMRDEAPALNDADVDEYVGKSGCDNPVFRVVVRSIDGSW